MTELKLDIDIFDNKEANLEEDILDELKEITLEGITKRIITVNGLLSLGIESIDCRKTVKGYHLRMGTKRYLTNYDILIIQALMGDDYKRGCLNFKRVKRGESNWNVLFSRKWDKYRNLKSYEHDKVMKTIKKIEQTFE